ncbi:hypothetical protein CCHR01_11846 [Colletotrichum chrysophilum]|uniref:Uncharacterized protein n=1 Tax=Colletotrichum chrysophilum TaxID=1836956 RepID=A0AAD9EEC4_9PEZI|nr:hypothetical protein CCHR01_11846 [Colletotrichum chrysophilum]
MTSVTLKLALANDTQPGVNLTTRPHLHQGSGHAPRPVSTKIIQLATGAAIDGLHQSREVDERGIGPSQGISGWKIAALVFVSIALAVSITVALYLILSRRKECRMRQRASSSTDSAVLKGERKRRLLGMY